MKIVLDTNVLVSGLISPFGHPAEIVRMVSANLLQLCYDARIISEYNDVLKRARFKFNKEKINTLLEQIEACGYIFAAKPLCEKLPDKDDEAFLEIALSSKVKYLITGNTKHFPKGEYNNIRIVSPGVFIEEYRK